MPYFGIGTWGETLVEGQQITVTAAYSGFITTYPITLSLDNTQSQRIDIELADSRVLNAYSNGNTIQDLAWQDGAVWAATSGGLVRWQPTDNSYVQLTTADGLSTNAINDIAISPDDTIWLATHDDINHYQPENHPEWKR